MIPETQSTRYGISRRTVLLGSIVGAFLATSVGVLGWHGGFARFAGEKKPKPLELSFSGPFSPNQKLMTDRKENPWVAVNKVAFSEEFNCLDVIWGFNGDPNSARKIHVTVTATAVDGLTYTLIDSSRADIRLVPPAIHGTAVTSFGATNKDALVLPRKPKDILSLAMRFVPMDSVSVQGERR